MMKKISITLFSASILLSGLSCYLFYIIAKLSLSQEKVNIHTTSKYQAYSMSTTRNIETIKASGLERHVLGKWRNLLARKLSIQEKTNTYTLLIEASGKFFDYVAMVTLFILGGIQVAQGYLSIGYLMAYYSLHLFYCSNLTGLLQAIKDAQVAYVSHLRVNTIFCYEEESRFKHASLHPSHNSPTITCQNLTFYYNKTVQPTLQNITIHIKPYQQIALVGSTGSGKSTLAKILCALYQPHTGTMAINGNDVTTLSPQELAGLFAYVSQDVSLFAGTLYENLTLWEKNIPTQRIERAIHTACLNELIASRTLTSKVSENGNNFSQGEKQRIDIARALIQNAEVLVLDEATAALDVQTEKQLIANLCTINKTIIYVAHRLSTIQHCDQILVMKNGIIVESGNHDKLLRQKSHYYELIENERGTHSACQ
jgi:ABC-type bacteriocin/lantibiotic exporter with double-glycine peptidase domain